ncbi:MAG TPA: hypothetical protein VL551_11785 [Actinospica sp.]|jgi:hypothetical protein|nr:hypothetical protein [Actinospica sp.]
MSASKAPFNPAEALGEHLAERVRAAVRRLLATADALTVEGAPNAGYTLAAVELRGLVEAVIEQAVSYDLNAGPGFAAVANALGVSERTVRSRYGAGPRDIPLRIVLAED